MGLRNSYRSRFYLVNLSQEMSLESGSFGLIMDNLRLYNIIWNHIRINLVLQSPKNKLVFLQSVVSLIVAFAAVLLSFTVEVSTCGQKPLCKNSALNKIVQITSIIIIPSGHTRLLKIFSKSWGAWLVSCIFG